MPHPYTSTVTGLVNALRQLRSSFPAQVDAGTLKKWGVASNNEGTVLVVLRFLGLIDDQGRKQSGPAKAFLAHSDEEFSRQFEPAVRAAYAALFETWGDGAWDLGRDKLITFFRHQDESSARVGLQQAATFQALAGLAGHGAAPAEPKAPGLPAKKASTSKAKVPPPTSSRSAQSETTNPAPVHLQHPAHSSVAMTVRIEINLPVSEKQEIYDNIFRSIRENLLNEPTAD
jgi:hypothetical protein